jgi:hypothetical protein
MFRVLETTPPPGTPPRREPAPPAIDPAWPGAAAVAAAVDAAAVVAVAWGSAWVGLQAMVALMQGVYELGLVLLWIPPVLVSSAVLVWASIWLGVDVVTGRGLGCLVTGTRLVSARTDRRPLGRAFAYRSLQVLAALVGMVVVGYLAEPAWGATLARRALGPTVGAVAGPVLIALLPSAHAGRGGWHERVTGVRIRPARRR